MMRERQQFEEVSTVVSLGLLAEDMVLVIGRVMRGDEMRERDRRVLEKAKRLLETLSSEDVVPVDLGADQMLADEAYLDALRALKLRAPEAEEQVAAAQLVALLDAVLRGELDEPMREQLLQLRAIFVDVGKSMLTRANDLARSRQEAYAWHPTKATSLS